MRVLHVIDAGPPLLREFARSRPELSLDVRALACQLAVEASTNDHRICLIGSRSAHRRLRLLNLDPDHNIPSILGRPGLAVGEMGRLLRAVRPDLIHVWNGHWTGGCIGRPGRAWRLETVLGATPLGLPFWLSSAQALACGPYEIDRATAAGFEAVPVDAPILLSSAPRSTQRTDAIRVLMLGPHADARRFVFLCTLLGRIGVTVCPVISVASDSMRRTRHFYRLIDRPLRATVTRRPVTELLQMCDLALWMGGPRGPCAASIRSALAAGVPVIVPPDGAWAIPASLHSHLVARNSTSAELARRVQACAEHPDIMKSVVELGGTLTNHGFLAPIQRCYSGHHFGTREPAGTSMHDAMPHGACA